MSDVVYEIFPAIGIARVGNAPESFYIGPEQAGGLPILPDEPARPFSASDFRDSEGRLRRQAARFRIWRRAPGAEFEEVTLDTKDVREIRWTVHLANKKASWYRFQTSKGQHGYGPNHPLRNADRQSAEDRRRDSPARLDRRRCRSRAPEVRGRWRAHWPCARMEPSRARASSGHPKLQAVGLMAR
jgi:hypothetical protein